MGVSSLGPTPAEPGSESGVVMSPVCGSAAPVSYDGVPNGTFVPRGCSRGRVHPGGMTPRCVDTARVATARLVAAIPCQRQGCGMPATSTPRPPGTAARTSWSRDSARSRGRTSRCWSGSQGVKPDTWITCIAAAVLGHPMTAVKARRLLTGATTVISAHPTHRDHAAWRHLHVQRRPTR